jgi:diguanylate cyclase (GGDEF)-like protein
MSTRVLIVEDDRAIARLLRDNLEYEGFEVEWAASGAEALTKAQAFAPALVLLDLMLPPGIDGYELCRTFGDVQGRAVIIITARGQKEERIKGLQLGADDYIVKPFDTPELLARVRGVLRRTKDMRDESPLTGLPGNVRIQEEIETRVETGVEFALLYVDLDSFKAFNDRYGFGRGDDVIRALGHLLVDVTTELAPEDHLVGHLGGDDFVAMVSPDAAALVAKTLVQRFDREAPTFYDGNDRERGHIEVVNRRGEPQRYPFLTLSIGIASTQRRQFDHYAEMIAVASEMKAYTKGQPGSSWAMDRRAGT